MIGKIQRMKRVTESQKQGGQNIPEKLEMSNEHTGGPEKRRQETTQGQDCSMLTESKAC